MLIIQVCVGSSCHLKGSGEIVEMLERSIAEYHIEDDEVALSGSFCIGKCNRVGVTVQVNDDVHVGVTTENFREFFKKNILDVVLAERK
jgi:NADH:ubiquinone oxidoreductase subunit E